MSFDFGSQFKKKTKGIIPIRMSPDLELKSDQLQNLIILMLNYLSIKDFKISHYLESILESCESKLETLSLLLRDCVRDA